MSCPELPKADASHPELLRLVADSLLRLPYEVWGFGESVAFDAMIAAYDALGDERWLRFAHGMFRGWASRARPFNRLDCTAPGLAMVETYRRTGDSRILEAALDLAEYLASRPRLHGVYATWEHSPLQHPFGPGSLPPDEVQLLAERPPGVFVDCLHFDPPFFTALGAVTGNERWTAEGIGQAVGYVRLLQEDSGLFGHFVLKGSARRYGGGWSRGQCWALLGLLNVLAQLGDHDARSELLTAARSVTEAMLRLQRPDGHWYAVADDPHSGDESSAAAFMAAALPVAGRMTGIAGTEAAATAALAAACAATGPEGTLSGVSAAVNACTQISHYAHVPRGFVVPWGQGPLALALAGQVSAQAVSG